MNQGYLMLEATSGTNIFMFLLILISIILVIGSFTFRLTNHNSLDNYVGLYYKCINVLNMCAHTSQEIGSISNWKQEQECKGPYFSILGIRRSKLVSSWLGRLCQSSFVCAWSEQWQLLSGPRYFKILPFLWVHFLSIRLPQNNSHR